MRFVFTLCGGHISPILVAAKGAGIRIVDTRDEATAVFAADAAARLTGTPGRGRGHRRPGPHQHHHRAQERAARAVAGACCSAARRPRRCRGAARCRTSTRSACWPPHVKLVQQVRRVRRPRPGGEEALVARARACPGRSSSSARSTCSTTRRSSASGTPTRPGKGTSIADRLLRWYLDRHAARMFAGSDRPYAPRRARWRRRRRARVRWRRPRTRCTGRERPLIVIGSQALVDAASVAARRRRGAALGVPVYLSGMARGLLGRDDRPADAP